MARMANTIPRSLIYVNFLSPSQFSQLHLVKLQKKKKKKEELNLIMSRTPTPHLPQEILINIFTRLPSKSVGKCRCLSKPWRTLLSSPQFIKNHLINTTLTLPHHDENLILIPHTLFLHVLTSIKENAVSKELAHLPPESWTKVVGSCDGLVLLVNEKDEMFLVNPTTLHHIKVPECSLIMKKPEGLSMQGLGYDGYTDDYKIVSLSCHYDPVNEVDTFVDVYSVKTGVWRRLEHCSPYHHDEMPISPGVLVNGALHWVSIKKEHEFPNVIAAFDLVREVFYEVPAPQTIDPNGENKMLFGKLVSLKGCLCLLDNRTSDDKAEIWMMKEYGVGDSWVKFSVEGLSGWEVDKPLCFSEDGVLALKTVWGGLCVRDFQDQGTWRRGVVDGVSPVFMDVGTFVESLVSPSASSDGFV